MRFPGEHLGLLGIVGDLQGIGQETLPALEGIAMLQSAEALEA